jgi:hypothetical protein
VKGKTCLITGADAYGRLIVHAALGEKSNPEKWQDVLGWVAENDKEWINRICPRIFDVYHSWAIFSVETQKDNKILRRFDYEKIICFYYSLFALFLFFC